MTLMLCSLCFKAMISSVKLQVALKKAGRSKESVLHVTHTNIMKTCIFSSSANRTKPTRVCQCYLLRVCSVSSVLFQTPKFTVFA